MVGGQVGGASRRSRQMGVTLAVAMLVALAVPEAGAAASASFSAADVTVESTNGRLNELTVAPSGTATYRGLEAEASATTVAIQVLVDGTWEPIGTTQVPATGLTGSVTYNFSTISILDRTSNGLTAADFRAPSPNQPTTTTVHIRVKVTFAEAGDAGADVTVTQRTNFDVTVKQTAGPPGGGGNGPP